MIDNELSQVLQRLLNDERKLYWITVAKGTNNLELGINNNIWGVQIEYQNKIDQTKYGDYIIFYKNTGVKILDETQIDLVLCRIQSKPFFDKTYIWPPKNNDYYTYRVVISDILHKTTLGISKLIKILVDKNEQTYKSNSALGRAIGGGGGVFREIKNIELHKLFQIL